MPLPVFSFKSQLGASLSCKPTVNQTKFGDGYELRVANGINSNPRRWSVKFPALISTQVEEFLSERGGVEAFLWVDPQGVEGSYVCREWNMNHLADTLFELSATFEQVFES